MVLHAHPLTLHAAHPYHVLLHVIDEFHDARFAGAVRTTKKSPVALDAVPDNAASAMFTRRRHALDRALKRVEHVHRAVGVHLERRRVIVTADFTYGHERAPLPLQPLPVVINTLPRQPLRYPYRDMSSATVNHRSGHTKATLAKNHNSDTLALAKVAGSPISIPRNLLS
jgi:hypothetical protein